MIIGGSEFEGDSRSVANAQHDVYYEALKIIVKKCNRFLCFVQHFTESEHNQSWMSGFDHRTLQFQHDLLATVWRYSYQVSQMRLDCDEDKSGIQTRWLSWLSAEVDDWIERPEWVRLVKTILDNQNSPEGYRAEALLNLAIMNYYFKVPWPERNWLELERDVERWSLTPESEVDLRGASSEN